MTLRRYPKSLFSDILAPGPGGLRSMRLSEEGVTGLALSAGIVPAFSAADLVAK
jgi:hypothetical protein